MNSTTRQVKARHGTVSERPRNRGHEGKAATALHGLAALAFTFASTWAAFWAAVCFLLSPYIVNEAVQQGWKRAAGLLRGTMHDADCDCDWVAMERLEKVDLRLRQGCSGVELQRQGIAGLQRRGTAACAQAVERPSS